MFNGWLVPIMDSGMFTNHGILDRRAIKKLDKRKPAAKTTVAAPTVIFVTMDLIKISVNPTSLYHHQSVIKETMFNRKIKRTVIMLKIAQEKILVMLNLRLV